MFGEPIPVQHLIGKIVHLNKAGVPASAQRPLAGMIVHVWSNDPAGMICNIRLFGNGIKDAGGVKHQNLESVPQIIPDGFDNNGMPTNLNESEQVFWIVPE